LPAHARLGQRLDDLAGYIPMEITSFDPGVAHMKMREIQHFG
jgi:hypothetical protein